MEKEHEQETIWTMEMEYTLKGKYVDGKGARDRCHTTTLLKIIAEKLQFLLGTIMCLLDDLNDRKFVICCFFYCEGIWEHILV